MRVLLASLLVAGAVALVAVSQPGSLLIALLVMLVVFLAGAARLAVDLIELVPGELVADVALLVVIGVALGLVPLGNARLTALLFVLGIATQAVPVLLARSTRTTGS